MAENFSDIMKNYGSMSVTELGTSLLQQKETKEKAAAKSSKKSAKVQQALGLLLAGQAVFKGAYSKRAKELKEGYTFELANNEQQTQEINNVALLTEPIYRWNDANKDKTFANKEEKLNSFFASEYFDPFRIAINPYTEPTMKRLLGNDFESIRQSSQYSNSEVEMAKQYADAYFTEDKVTKQERYKTVESELRKLFGDDPTADQDMDALDLFQRSIGLSHNDLNRIEKRNYEKMRGRYRGKAGLFQGVKDVFKSFGDKNESSGGINLFKSVDTDTLSGPTIERMLNSLDLKGLTNRIVNEQVVAMGRSNTRWLDQLDLPKNKQAIDLMDLHYESLRDRVGGRVLDDYGTFEKRSQILGRGDMDDMFDNMTLAQQRLLKRDGAGMTLMLDPINGDQKLIQSIFASNHKGVKGDPIVDLATFKARLQNPSFRGEYALVLTMSEGMVKKGITGTSTQYQPTGAIATQVYDRYQGRVPYLMGEGIIEPTKANPNYGTDDVWGTFSTKIKKEAYLATVLKIQKKNVSETAKETELTNFMSGVVSPFNYNMQELLESPELILFAQQSMKKISHEPISRRDR